MAERTSEITLEELFVSYANKMPESQRRAPYQGLPSVIANAIEEAKLVEDYYQINKVYSWGFSIKFDNIKMRTRPIVHLNNVILVIEMSEWCNMNVTYNQEQYSLFGSKREDQLKHPHISEGGTPCYGSFQSDFIQYTQTFYGKFPNIIRLIQFCRAYLRKYNERSCYYTRDAMLPQTVNYNLNHLKDKDPVWESIELSSRLRAKISDQTYQAIDTSSEKREELRMVVYQHVKAVRSRLKSIGFEHIDNGLNIWYFMTEMIDVFTNARGLRQNTYLTAIYELLSFDGAYPGDVYELRKLPKFQYLAVRLNSETRTEIQTCWRNGKMISPEYGAMIKFINYIPLDYSFIEINKSDSSKLVYDTEKLKQIKEESYATFFKEWCDTLAEAKKLKEIVIGQLKNQYLEKINKIRKELINELSEVNYTVEDGKQSNLFAQEVS